MLCFILLRYGLGEPIIAYHQQREGLRKERILSHITPAVILEKQIVPGIEKSQGLFRLNKSLPKAKCKTRNTSQMLLLYYHL